MNKTGSPEVLELIECPDLSPKLDEVLIDLKAIGLNWSEIMIRKGEWPLELGEGFVLGAEGAGIVEEVGPEVKNIRPGERVVVLDFDAYKIPSQGTYAEKIVVCENKVLPIPGQLHFSDAAALPVAWLTAYDAMINSAPLPESGILVITASTGAVGIAASQLGKIKGLRVISTTRSENMRPFISGLGVDVVVAEDSDEIKNEIYNKTRGKGIDYIFDPISGKTATELISLLNSKGTYLCYGFLSDDKFTVPSSFLFNQNLIKGYVVLHSLQKPDELQRVWRDLMPIMDETHIPVAKTFAFENAPTAHQEMEKHGHFGKLVLVR